MLATRERFRPKQTSLRRAVSSAYYSVFHLLVDAASRFLVSGAGRRNLRHWISRGFHHRDMKRLAVRFRHDDLPLAIEGPPRAELRRIACAFSDLQEARHEADYDLSRSFSRPDVVDLVDQASQAHADWEAVRGTSQADAFLVGLFALRHVRG